MVLTVSAYKGGVGKTTTAVHVAGVLGEREPTLLLDRERVHGALKWYRKRDDWSFQAVAASDVDPNAVRRYRREGSVVIDTPAAPTPEELAAFGLRSDLVIVPTTPDSLALEALVETVRDLKRASVPYRVLLVAIPPWPSRAGPRTRAALDRAGVPTFRVEIPRAAAFTHAARQGRLVRDVRDRRSASLWSAYQELVNEIDHARREA